MKDCTRRLSKSAPPSVPRCGLHLDHPSINREEGHVKCSAAKIENQHIPPALVPFQPTHMPGVIRLSVAGMSVILAIAYA